MDVRTQSELLELHLVRSMALPAHVNKASFLGLRFHQKFHVRDLQYPCCHSKVLENCNSVAVEQTNNRQIKFRTRKSRALFLWKSKKLE